MAADIWNELAEAYGRLIRLGHDFLKQADSEPPAIEAWEDFISARHTCLECADISLKIINVAPAGPEQYSLNPKEQKLRDKVESQLKELRNMETKLARLLTDDLKETKNLIEKLGQGQAVFKGYGQLNKHTSSHLPKLVDQRG